MDRESRIRLNHQISEEAAEWFVEFRAGDIDAAGRQAFDAWVRASPEHLRAFIELAALWSEAGSVDAQRKLDVEDLIARARAESHIVALGQSSPTSTKHTSVEWRGQRAGGDCAESSVPQGPAQRHSRPLRSLSAAAAFLAVAGVGLMAWFQFYYQPTYATDIGEQRRIRLADGSTAILNSRSRLRVSFTEAARTVELLEGQALFHVAKNPARPFIVHSDGTVVRAVGTQFDVNRHRSGTIVTVVEGRVAVYSKPRPTPAFSGKSRSDDSAEVRSEVPAEESTSGRPAERPLGAVNNSGRKATQAASHQWTPLSRGDVSEDDAPILLSAGEQLKVIDGEGSAQPVRANVSSAIAWTQGQLVLESASLAEVAEEFNRYSSRKLIIEDHGASPLRLSGVFATDPDFLIRYLRERSDIMVHETDTEVDIVRNAPK